MIESRFSRFAQLCPEEERGTRLVSIAIEKDVSKEKCGRGLGRARASNAIPPLALYTFSTAPIFQPRLPFSRLSIDEHRIPFRIERSVRSQDGIESFELSRAIIHPSERKSFPFYQRIHVSIFHSLKTSIDPLNRFNYPLSMPREKNFEFQRRTLSPVSKANKLTVAFAFGSNSIFDSARNFTLFAPHPQIYIYIFFNSNRSTGMHRYRLSYRRYSIDNLTDAIGSRTPVGRIFSRVNGI